ncbi:MAG: hypothetical protein P8Q84_00600 [Luminiphilus sp.]|nr:hypothetical protein [Luminiphilus sp.]
MKDQLSHQQRACKSRPQKQLTTLALLFMLQACAMTPDIGSQQAKGVTACDTYLLFSMCVQDIDGDNTVDMVYFTDTKEAFMYQEGKQALVGTVIPFHRCAVPLDAGMQSTTNRLLQRENLSLTEEISITKELIVNYASAKPAIDACNARFEDTEGDGKEKMPDFSQFEEDWEQQ